MNDNNLFHIKDAFTHLIKQYNLQNSIVEFRMKEIWKQTVGEYINNATTKIQFVNQTLIVHINSSIIRQELFYAKQEIIDTINEKLKDYKILEIRFK